MSEPNNRDIGLSKAAIITRNHHEVFHMVKPGSSVYFIANGAFEAEWWMAQGYYALHPQSGKIFSTSSELWA